MMHRVGFEWSSAHTFAKCVFPGSDITLKLRISAPIRFLASSRDIDSEKKFGWYEIFPTRIASRKSNDICSFREFVVSQPSWLWAPSARETHFWNLM